MRLLLDPNAGAGGAPAAPAAPAPVAAPAAPTAGQPGPAPVVNYHIAAPAPAPAGTIAPAPVAPAAATQQTVTLPLEQLQALMSMQARLADMESAQRAQQEAAQREQAALLMQKGQLEEGLRLLREQSEQQIKTVQDSLTQTRSQASNYAIDVEVARAMAGHVFANDKARRAFESEVRSELVAEAHGNTFAVRTPTFQSATDLVNGKLANPEYAFLLAPKGVVPAAPAAPASSGAYAGPTSPANTPPPPPEEPRNLGRDIIRQHKHNVAARTVDSDPRLDPGQSFGLRAAPVR